MSIPLEKLLEQIPKDTRERVDRTRKQVASSLRDAIRRETGLLLQRKPSEREGRDSVSVPVSLEAGLPTALRDMEFPDDYWLVLMVSPYKGDLERMAVSSARVGDLLARLAGDERGHQLLQGRERHLPPVQALVREMLAIVQKDNPVRRILEVNEDVLGVYRYRLPANNSLFPEDPMSGEIILYWGVIGLVAGLLGVTIEDLTVVVLGHEVAHAYTHLGADIDGLRWDSSSFAASDHALKEGLAQYYTVLVNQRLATGLRNVDGAYEALLAQQPPAYHTHRPWVQKNKPEEVRLAMIESRRRGAVTTKGFGESLQAARSTLRVSHTEQS